VVVSLGVMVFAGASALAQAPPVAPRTEAARLYLSQSLASLHEARRTATSVAELGGVEGFELARYLAELDQIQTGLQRYLVPDGPGPEVAAPVEITGRYLLEGLQRSIPPARIRQPGE